MRFIDEFLLDLKYAKNYSSNTIVSYQNDLSQFAEFVKVNLDKVSGDDIKKYIRSLHELKEKSLARKLSSLRMFYDFMVKRRFIAVSPMTGIDGPKIGKYLPDVLSVEEVDRLLDFTCDNDFSFRNRCILELLYSTGLRISELVSLKLENIVLDEAFVKVMVDAAPLIAQFGCR